LATHHHLWGNSVCCASATGLFLTFLEGKHLTEQVEEKKVNLFQELPGHPAQ